jgi:hypothetical protein
MLSADPDGGQYAETVLVARSMAECHLYMYLHPCPHCGEPEFSWTQHGAGIRDGQHTSHYEGECPTCRSVRRFDFIVLDYDLAPPALGGPEPSQIIDPAEFLDAGDRAVPYAVIKPGATPDDVAMAYDAAVDAVTTVEEVLKFIPPGAAVVPETVFGAPAGRAALVADPGRFSRERLETVLAERRQVLAAVTRDMDAIDWDAVE